jgi:hypothetical protein
LRANILVHVFHKDLEDKLGPSALFGEDFDVALEFFNDTFADGEAQSYTLLVDFVGRLHHRKQLK